MKDHQEDDGAKEYVARDCVRHLDKRRLNQRGVRSQPTDLRRGGLTLGAATGWPATLTVSPVQSTVPFCAIHSVGDLMVSALNPCTQTETRVIAEVQSRKLYGALALMGSGLPDFPV